MSTQTTTDKTNSRYLKDSHHARFAFHSAALDPSTFFVSHFTATEEISQPFRVEIDLLSHDPDIDAELIINELATFSLETKGNAREFYGILAEFNQGEEGVDGLYHYQAVLVPRLWQMGLSVQNQIYQNLSVPEIIEAELLGSSEKHEEEHAAIALDSTDFEFRLTREYEIKEYVVQYKESDLNFISRLAEQAGIFYFFEFENGREKLIFSDNNIQFPFICDEHEVRYVRQSALMGYEEASVQSFNLKKTRTPNKVVISDYNYRKPTTPLKATASIESNGVGLLSEYGSHFKTPDEGEVLAKIRAEEISARKNIYTGASDCAYFRVGHVFTLAGHYREASNQEYLITKVRHEGALEDLSTLKPGTTHMESTSYRNSFSALPLSMAYRPQRATPIPKLYGIMNAHIDGAGEGDYAEIDEFGRYKVVMPFDLTSTGGGKASRYIRMAQPSSGSNQGFHFPLRKGTEIIWTCIDGDLDRPVIVGAVPNARTPSPVNAENHRRNIIRTGGGNEINIDDNSGSQRIKLTTPHGGGTTIQMGAPNGPEDGLLLATAGGSTAISGIGKTVMSPFKSVYSFFTTKNAKGITSIAKKESDKSVLDYFGLAAGMLTTLGALGSVTLKTVQSVQKEIINEQEGCVNEGEEEVYNKKKELDDLYEQDAQRLEAVLNAFPNATTSGSPHTTEEQAFIDQLLLFSRSKEEKLTARKTVEDKRKDLEKALKANEDYKYTDLILGIELANENRLGFGVNVYPSTTTDGRDIQELEGKDTQIFAHAADANTVFQNLFQRNDSGAPLEPAAFVSDSVSCTVSPQELRDLFATWFDQHRSFENPQRDLDTVMKRTHLQTVEFLEAKTDFESGSTANDEEIADSVFKGAMASEGVFSLISKLIGMFQHKEVKLKVQRFWNRPARALNRALDNRLRSMWPSDLPQEGLTTFVDPAQDYYHILGAETATAVYGKKNLICYADTAILGGIRTGGPENNSPIPNQGVAIVYAENNAIVYSECNAELSANRRTFVSGQYVDLKGEDSVEITTGENGEIWISQGMMGATTRAKITIRDNKIEIEGMDVNIKATGNLCLEATQNLEIKAGVNIDIDANAQTNIRGGIVNLN